MSSIIKGYKGVMDLDLSLVPKMYEKEAVEQHYKDIYEYKKYQKTLKPQHRYENTVERIHKRLEKENIIRNEKKIKEEKRRHELCLSRKITIENYYD
tara:strand:- start:5736 stop:6026 length:291 start_codon:yes stop_codon:yes gene_type:complete